MIQRNTTQPFDFFCISDRNIKGVECLPLKHSWCKRLNKLSAYDTSYGLTGRQVSFDLDTVITGNIDHILAYDGKFCTVEDFWRPGLPGCAINASCGGDKDLEEKLYSALVRDEDKVQEDTGGNERFWVERQLGTDIDFFQTLHPNQIFSAKPERHFIRKTIPEDARIICFHGKEKPHAYTHLSWVMNHWE